MIFTRRIGERTMIGDDIVITILGVKGNHVRIGIKAPKGVAVDREEIREKKLADSMSEAERVDR